MTKIVDIVNKGDVVKGAAVDLKKIAAGCRVSFTKFGIKCSLSDEQRNQAAEVFDASGEYLEARRRKIDTKHPAWKAVSAVFSQCKDYWKSLTVPYPEPGIRLIRQAHITGFVDTIEDFQASLKDVVENLDKHIHELKAMVKNKAGSLYNEADYPTTFGPLFRIDFDFPSLEPPEYLKKLAPQVYDQEVARIQARFNEAVVLAEQAFTAEFHKLAAHLTEVISGGKDGQRKVFKDAAVENLTEFFDRFKVLNVHSNKDLDELVEQCQNLTKGISPDDIRSNDSLRTSLAQRMSEVSKSLEGMLVAAPKRKVKKGIKATNGNGKED